jgi:hypothetical protein
MTELFESQTSNSGQILLNPLNKIGNWPMACAMYVSRFIPRQVSTKSRIVFHGMASSGKQVTDDKTPSLKRSSKHMESSDVPLDASIVEIHKKIRMVNILKALPG